MKQAMTAINPDLSLSKVSVKIKPARNAPMWVKDGFYELLKSGKSSQEAIATLKKSPFFKDEFYVA